MRVGELIAGRYELEELVGEGAMARVYRAHDAVLERRVALKVLHDHYSDDPEYVERFRREARSIARLAHPNIVTVIDRGEWEGRQFIVFEHVAGENLKDVIEREGALPVERALVLVHQVGRALAFAHELDVVHRDVKPQNVLVDDAGAAKVTDFGIARTLDFEDGLTQTGTVLGTGHYLSPEQARGERADERSDQYSLGVLAYELLTGEVPFPGESLVGVATRHLNDPVPSVRALRPEVHPRVEAVVARAMAKDPGDRFPALGTMLAALEACMADPEVLGREDGEATGVIPALPTEALAPTPTPGRPARVPRRSRGRRPGPRVVGVAVLLVLALAAGFLAVELAREDRLPGLGGLPGVEADGGGGGGGGGAGDETPVELSALSDFDPEGDGTEHPEDVPAATDGDPATYWTTETYRSFTKPGVGLVLDAGAQVALSRLVVVSDEPGFTAIVRAGPGPEGPFEDVSEEQEVGRRTSFDLDTGGRELRYYLIWITEPNSRAHVNEVRAFSSAD